MDNSTKLRAGGRTVIALLLCAVAACGDRREDGDAVTNVEQGAAASDSSALMQQWCADCHLPPPAASHKARDWRNVVMRMQKHRLAGGLADIGPQDMEKLISYLEANASH